MASKIALSDINKLLGCPVCMDRFSWTNLPKILPCSHNVCALCLQLILRDQTLSCPTCDTETRLQTGDVNSLITNLVILQLADIEPLPTCQECQQENETVSCFHCELHVCSECLRKHAEDADAQLRELQMTDPVSEDPLLYRMAHTDKPVRMLQTWRNGKYHGKLSWPLGVAVEEWSGGMFVADGDHHMVHMFTSSGIYAKSIGGRGRSLGQLNLPSGISINQSSEVIVCETNNERCQMFTNTGESIREFGQRGSGEGVLKRPTDVTVDNSNNMYVTSSMGHCINVYSKDGTYCRSFGTQGSGPGQFESPRYIQWSRGMCVVCDSNGAQLWSDGGEFIRSIGASTDPEPLIAPTGVTADQHGHLLVLDVGDHTVKVYSTEGQFITKLLVAECEAVHGNYSFLACTPEGAVIVSDSESKFLLFYCML